MKPILSTHSSILSGVAIALSFGLTKTPAIAFDPDPKYTQIETYSTEIPDGEGNTDPTDIYYPVLSDSEELPIALFLQGALVDKADYSNYASLVAQYGFIVVVPNNERSVTNPVTGELVTGLLPEPRQVNDTLNYLIEQNSNPDFPLAGIVDTDTLGLLGHSMGGAIGLGVIQEICAPVVCPAAFNRPEAVMAGIFFGANFRLSPSTDFFPPVNNDGIPTALIQGDRDSVGLPSSAEATYLQIQDPPKALITVVGANHYGITNEDNPIRDPNSPTLEQAIALRTIARWSALFLRAHLLDDADAFDYIYNSGDASDENVTVVSERQTVPEPTATFTLLIFEIIGGTVLKKSSELDLSPNPRR